MVSRLGLNFCSSCQAKRSVLFAEKLTSEILAPVPHRHWTFSIPRVLRGLIERDRKLLGLLSQTAYAAILKTFQAFFDRADVRPGCVISLRKLEDGNLALETPPDPSTGATRVVLEPLEWIHRITAHIPDPASHCQRFYGAYSNRGRIVCAGRQAHSRAAGAPAPEARDNSDFTREARSTWARLVRKIFEADPLTCGACGARMRIVSFITDPRVIDRILRHRQSERCRAEDPFEPRAPPLSRPHTVQ